MERTEVVDFAETIKLRVVDSEETFAIDEYFFTFFSAGEEVLGACAGRAGGTERAGRETPGVAQEEGGDDGCDGVLAADQAEFVASCTVQYSIVCTGNGCMYICTEYREFTTASAESRCCDWH